MKNLGLAMVALIAATAAAEDALPALSVETLSPTTVHVKDVRSQGSLLNRYGVIEDMKAPAVAAPAGGKVDGAFGVVEAKLEGKGWTIRFPLEKGERVYGLGDASRQGIQRRPGRYEMYVKNIASYIPIPMVVTSKGRGFLLNTTWPSVVDVGKADPDAIVCTVDGGDIDFYVFTGRDYRELLDAYTRLTGRPALLPAFAFGFSYVCNQWIDAFNLLREARDFRDREVPCDVIGLEPGWMETFYDFSTRKRWDPGRFYMPYWMKPDSRNFFSRGLERMGFKLSLWLCCNYDLTRYEEELLEGKWKGAMERDAKPQEVDETFVDDHVVKPNAIRDPRYNVECGRARALGPEGTRPWFEHLKYFCDTGARCFKLDASSQANPSPRKWANGRSDAENHNAYPVIYAKQMSEGYETYTKCRAMVYTSCGFTGIQRYVATWAGDTGGGVGTLVSCLNLAASGHSSQSCDMSIFGADMKPNPAAIHYGFLSPWSQQNNWDYHNQPWYQENEGLESFRAMDGLRYRLFPYLYTAAAEAHRTGWPMMRPLAFVHPDREDYADVVTTYYLGDDLVVTAFADEEIVPPGEWYDFFDGVKVVGPARRKVVPSLRRGGGLLVRAGAVVPMWPLKQHLDRGWNETVELHVWPGDGETTLYEDDGDSLAYRDGAYALTKIVNRGGKLEIGQRQGSFAGMPAAQPKFVVVNESVPRRRR